MFEMFEEFCRAKAEQSRSKYLRKQTPGAAIYRARIEREEKIRLETRLYQLKGAIRCSYMVAKKKLDRESLLTAGTWEEDGRIVDDMISYLKSGNKVDKFMENFGSVLSEMEECYSFYY